MKKKKKWIKWVVILVIVAAVVGWFMMVSRKTQDVAYTNVQATLGSIETYYNFDGWSRPSACRRLPPRRATRCARCM